MTPMIFTKYMTAIICLALMVGCGGSSSDDRLDQGSTDDPIANPETGPIEDPITDPIEDPIEDPIADPIEDPITDPIEDPITDPIVEEPDDDVPAVVSGLSTSLNAYKYNDVYWLRPHNSYEQTTAEDLESLLEMGYYVVELDVFPDLSVKHNETDALKNFCNPINELPNCIEDIIKWGDAHPGHLPMQIQLDLKQRTIRGGATWDEGNFQNLNRVIGNSLDDRLFKPTDLDISNIRAHVKDKGWPTISNLRGKVMFFMMGGRLGDKNNNQEEYVNLFVSGIDGLSTSDMNIFVCPNVDDDFEHFESSNNAKDFNEITSRWVVCGNSSGNTENARIERVAITAHNNRQLLNLWVSGSNNSKYEDDGFLYTAVGWGASWISQDRYPARFEGHWDSQADIYGHGSVKAGKRASKPIVFEIVGTSSGNCLDVRSANYENETPIQSWPCNGTNAQKWIYTTERQLRPAGGQKYCLDINGGMAGMGRKIHLWDCDGGSSEKWSYMSSGQFLSSDNEYSYAIDNNFGDIETQAHTWEQEPYNTNQIFDLIPRSAVFNWDRW